MYPEQTIREIDAEIDFLRSIIRQTEHQLAQPTTDTRQRDRQRSKIRESVKRIDFLNEEKRNRTQASIFSTT